jgi:formylglycine-generating enzyme required for sulfatase activity
MQKPAAAPERTACPSWMVAASGFCIDRLEVTVAEYMTCHERGACPAPAYTNDWDGITSDDHKTFDALCNARDPKARATHPMNCVDYEAAERFCVARGSRLPRETEWETAARGLDARAYPWGNEPPTSRRVNACGTECAAWGTTHQMGFKALFPADDGYPGTAPVGSFPDGRSPYGALDMAGNVWEWARPASGDERAIRGGAWSSWDPAWLRSSFRTMLEPHTRSYVIGFRCARSM